VLEARELLHASPDGGFEDGAGGQLRPEAENLHLRAAIGHADAIAKAVEEAGNERRCISHNAC